MLPQGEREMLIPRDNCSGLGGLTSPARPGSGSDPGQFTHPHGMAFDSHGHLYVADAGNQRIQKFEIPQP